MSMQRLLKLKWRNNMAKKAQTQPENFEVALKELEEIVQKLERGELPLEEALAAYQQGVNLSQYCQQTLVKAEEVVAKIATTNGDIPFEAK